MKFFPILFLLLFFISACGSLKKVVEPPKIELEKIKVDKLHASKADLSVVLSATNPNNIDFDVKSLKYSLDIDGKVVTSGTMSEKVLVKSKDKTVVSIPIVVLYKDIFKSALMLLQKEGLPYRIQGNVEVGPFNIPFDDNGNLKKDDL